MTRIMKICFSVTSMSMRVLLFVMLSAQYAFSQGLAASAAVKEPKFLSPNAASIGKFGDIPVSYHTGVPEISVPLYTVQEGSLSVPISLAYHSNGVKVDEVASWVGLGWNLVAGGSISRTIIGGPDEGKSITYLGGSDCGYRGWYKDYGISPCLILDTGAGHCGSVNQGDGRGSGSTSSCFAYYMAASRGTIDTEPDLYSFSMPGHSGKFFFDNNRTAQMIPQGDYYIQPEVSPVLFNKWKIISPDGTKYFFGGTGVATENTYSFGGMVNSPDDDKKASTTWYLTRMESPNGEHWIEFQYAAEQSSYGTKASQTWVRADIGAQQSGSHTIAEGMTITSIDGWRLSKIITSSGHTTVDFLAPSLREDLSAYLNATSANTQAKSLSQIKVIVGSGCKLFSLSTNYFSSDRSNPFGVTPETPYDAKRLKLISVQESTWDGSITYPSTVFTYDETIQLPRRYSFGQDHWGYPNGQSNTTLIPPFNDPFSGAPCGGANRNPDEASMKSGILTKITYPTRGFTQFTYEAHKETPSSTTIVGGLRIKTMVDDDGSGNTVTRNYNYLQGILYQGPYSYTQFTDTNPNVYPDVNHYEFGIIYSSSPVAGLNQSQGYHIGYSIVETTSPTNGKSVYHYTNTYPFFSSQYPQPPTTAVIGTAALYKEEHFNQAGGLLRSVLYNYVVAGPVITITGKRIIGVYPFGPDTDPSLPYPLYTDYPIQTRRYQLASKVESMDGVTTTTSYTYDSNYKHNFPKSEEFNASDGLARRVETTYPGDAGSGAPAVMYDPVNADFKNMLGHTVEQKNLTNGVVTAKSANEYTGTQGRVLLTKTKTYPTGTSDYEEANYEYDGTGNPVIFKKNDGTSVSYLWGYNSKYPIAEIINAVIPATSPGSFVCGTTITGNVGSCTTLAPGTFTTDFYQSVSFTVSVVGGAGLSTVLTLKNGSTTYFGPKAYAPGSYNESVYLQPGTYEYCYTATGFPGGYCSINVTSNYQSNLTRPSAFHSSFEENGTADSNPKTGKKILNGTYNLVMPSQIGTYIITYWKRPTGGGPWVLQELSVTTSSSTPPDQVLGQSGYVIDEVRMYPLGAHMTTHAYDPAVGILSSTDANNFSSYYEYDASGRLIVIRDDNNNIIKTYKYNYKN